MPQDNNIPPDPLKDLHQRDYVEGQKVVSQEVATKRFEAQNKLLQQALKVAGETIDVADEFAKGDNPDKKKLAEYIKRNVMGAAAQIAAGKVPVVEEGGRVAIEAHPFSQDSPKSETASSGSMKALPHEPGQPSPNGQPVKRGRGRPRKPPAK